MPQPTFLTFLSHSRQQTIPSTPTLRTLLTPLSSPQRGPSVVVRVSPPHVLNKMRARNCDRDTHRHLILPSSFLLSSSPLLLLWHTSFFCAFDPLPAGYYSQCIGCIWKMFQILPIHLLRNGCTLHAWMACFVLGQTRIFILKNWGNNSCQIHFFVSQLSKTP